MVTKSLLSEAEPGLSDCKTKIFSVPSPNYRKLQSLLTSKDTFLEISRRLREYVYSITETEDQE